MLALKSTFNLSTRVGCTRETIVAGSSSSSTCACSPTDQAEFCSSEYQKDGTNRANQLERLIPQEHLDWIYQIQSQC